MRKILLLICASVILIGCEKEKIVEVEVEKEYSWKAHQRFTHENVTQMNSFATDDYIYFKGLSTFTSMVRDGKKHHKINVEGNAATYYLSNSQSHEMKFPISKYFSISYTDKDGEVMFYSTMNPNNTQQNAFLNMKDVDYKFEDLKSLRFHYNISKCCDINDRNQALIPYTAHKTNDNPSHISRLALIDVSVKDGENIEIAETKIIDIPEEWQGNLYAIESVGEYFFITFIPNSPKLLRVDSQGNIMLIYNSLLGRIIESSGTLYGFSLYGGINGSALMSSDKGLTWKEINNNTPTPLFLLSLSKVGDKIVGNSQSQLWEITLNEEEVTVRELANDGLDGVSITSISLFDNNVYVSTMSGVFYKPVDDFFESKIIEEE